MNCWCNIVSLNTSFFTSFCMLVICIRIGLLQIPFLFLIFFKRIRMCPLKYSLCSISYLSSDGKMVRFTLMLLRVIFCFGPETTTYNWFLFSCSSLPQFHDSTRLQRTINLCNMFVIVRWIIFPFDVWSWCVLLVGAAVHYSPPIEMLPTMPPYMSLSSSPSSCLEVAQTLDQRIPGISLPLSSN